MVGLHLGDDPRRGLHGLPVAFQGRAAGEVAPVQHKHLAGRQPLGDGGGGFLSERSRPSEATATAPKAI